MSEKEWEFSADVTGIVFAETEEEARQEIRRMLSKAGGIVDVYSLHAVGDE